MKLYLIIIPLIILNNICFSDQKNDLKFLQEVEGVIHVLDNENLFLEEEKKCLKKKLFKFYKRTKKEVFVVSTSSIGNFDSIESYGNYLLNIYEKESKNKNIVVISLSKKLRTTGISLSEDVSRKISNDLAKKIIQEEMIPLFKKNNYFKGVEKGISKIIKYL